MAYRRYEHSKFTVEHQGIKANIQENGKIIISNESEINHDDYDEIEVPASIIFKIAQALKLTRKITYNEEPLKKV